MDIIFLKYFLFLFFFRFFKKAYINTITWKYVTNPSGMHLLKTKQHKHQKKVTFLIYSNG